MSKKEHVKKKLIITAYFQYKMDLLVSSIQINLIFWFGTFWFNTLYFDIWYDKFFDRLTGILLLTKMLFRSKYNMQICKHTKEGAVNQIY